MSDYLNIIRDIGFVKKLRVVKWKKLARKNLFSDRERIELEQHPDRIAAAVHAHLLAMPDRGDATAAEMEQVICRSSLSRKTDLDPDTLKADMLFCHFAYGFTFHEYVCYRLYEKSREERAEYLSDRDSACICYDLNDLKTRMILADKWKTYTHFKSYYKREAIEISTDADLEAFLRFAEKHSRFVKKNTLESCGRSVELIDLAEIQDQPETLFRTWISEGKTILEEVVCQSEELAGFNRSSVNTLRCITVKTGDRVLAPYTFMKSGRSGSFVDNGAAGGLLIAVDRESGVMGSAIDEYGNSYDAHPDSQKCFVGFQLPDWQQVIDMCCEMSAKLPDVRIIGWDLAHTDQGWVVIEGNSMTEFIGPQSTSNRGARREMLAYVGQK